MSKIYLSIAVALTLVSIPTFTAAKDTKKKKVVHQNLHKPTLGGLDHIRSYPVEEIEREDLNEERGLFYLELEYDDYDGDKASAEINVNQIIRKFREEGMEIPNGILVQIKSFLCPACKGWLSKYIDPLEDEDSSEGLPQIRNKSIGFIRVDLKPGALRHSYQGVKVIYGDQSKTMRVRSYPTMLYLPLKNSKGVLLRENWVVNHMVQIHEVNENRKKRGEKYQFDLEYSKLLDKAAEIAISGEQYRNLK